MEDLSNATEVDYSRKYKTLDPTHRVRNHHNHVVQQDNPNNFNSLERGTRRRLPTVPNSQSHNALNTQSLPRPPKVRENESRSRDRLEKNRSQSFEEEPGNRRQLPNVPKKPVRQNTTTKQRDNNREPTPDYDSEKDKEVKNNNSTPLATSPVKTKLSPEKTVDVANETLDNATIINNRNAENLNQTRGKTIWFSFNWCVDVSCLIT